MLHIHAFAIGPLQTNCYIIENGREAVCIDPGGDPRDLIEFLRERRLQLRCILCTHLHFDHTFGVADLSEASEAPVYAAQADKALLENEFGKGGVWGLPPVRPFTYTPLEPGDMPLLGGVCRVLATPGHTPGGLSFYFPEAEAVFAGDTLFKRSIGRSDFPGGDSEILLRSIKEQLFTLPDQTIVYPGHGEATSIGEEKRHNPFAGDFI